MKLALMTLVFCCTASSPALAGNVLVVGAGAGQVANIQAAIDAAIDGDVILVKAGTYPTFSVPNKELSIVAEQGHVVNIDGAMRVRNMTVDRTVVLSGFHATGRYDATSQFIGNGFFATNCAGSIRLFDCTLTGFSDPTVPCGTPARSGIEIENCADVAAVRCTLRGSSNLNRNAPTPGQHPAGYEGPGLAATGSSIALFDTTTEGGAGGNLCNGYNDGASGGHGAWIVSSLLFASGSVFLGGHGVSEWTLWSYGGNGGTGIWLQGASSIAHLLSCTATAGLGGSGSCGGPCGTCCNGHDGSPIFSPPGAVDVLPAADRVLSGAVLAREDTAHPLTITGPPGDTAAIAFRRDTAFAWSASHFGVQLLRPTSTPTRYMILGTIPAGGVLTTTFAIPKIATLDPGQTQHVQLVTIGSTSTLRLGTPLSLVMLDSAF